jgi:Mlc titration factor MtfA (ptsG expression regulator)
MNPWLFLSLVLVAIALALWIPRYRLKRAVEAPFPEEWVPILEGNIQVYRDLPRPLREQLRLLIKQFLHEKHFTGAGGLEITDEIRVTIAAEACMLILNRPSGVYPGLRYIIVYPTAFIVESGYVDDAGVVDPSARDLLGESWDNGRVILAWDSVIRGGRNFTDGQNVVLHEFAHQLDSETGYTDGAPLLGGPSSYRAWASVLSEEFEDLREDALSGRRSIMDHYGASNAAEFFAVATETFFEKPRQMAKHHEELFEIMTAYYRIDPRDWSSPLPRAASDQVQRPEPQAAGDRHDG